MKKLILFLLSSVSIAIGMQKSELPVIVSGKQPVSQNSFLQPTDENLTRIIFSGSLNELKKMLDEGIISSNHQFKNGLFKDKSLLQAILELQVPLQTGKENRYEMARLLLQRGADKRDLDAFLVPAVKAADAKLVKLLVENGVQDRDGKAAAELVTQLENGNMPQFKKQALLEIKELLSGRRSLVTPIMRRPGK